MRASLPLGLATATVFVGLGALAINHQLVGVFNDDAIYLSSGLSLVETGAYRIDFLPGAPLAGKYPPLFPLILGLSSPLLPGLPGGLPYYKALSLLLSAPGFVFLAAWLAQPIRGLSPGAARAIPWLTALAASLMATVIEVMSEGLFFSLAMGALYAADPIGKQDPPQAMVSHDGRRFAVACVLTWLACYTRGVGIALLAALLLGAARSQPRRALMAGAWALAGLAPWVYWSRVYVPAHEPMAAVLPYLLSYDFHTHGLSAYLTSPDAEPLRYAVLSVRSAMLGLSGALLPFPADGQAPADPWAPLGPVVWLLAGVMTLGAAAELRRGRLYALFVVLYAGLVGIWPWFNKARFFVVVVPLLWLLGLRGIEALTAQLPRLRPALLATCVGLFGLSQLGHYFGHVFLGGTVSDVIAADGQGPAPMALERSLAWVTHHTQPNAVLVTNMSGPLYGIHTGRAVLPYRMALQSAADDIAASVDGRDPVREPLSHLLTRAHTQLANRPLVHIRLCPNECPPMAGSGPIRASFRDHGGGPVIQIEDLASPE